MEQYKKKMLNLLNEVSDSKFVTRKWNIVNDHKPFQDIFNTHVKKWTHK